LGALLLRGGGGEGRGGKCKRGGKGRKGKDLSLPKVNFLVTSLGRGGKEGRAGKGEGRGGEVCVIAVGGIDAPGMRNSIGY